MAAVESTESTKKAPRTSFLDKINRAINGRLERMFEALGRLIGARPIVVIIRALASAFQSAIYTFSYEYIASAHDGIMMRVVLHRNISSLRQGGNQPQTRHNVKILRYYAF